MTASQNIILIVDDREQNLFVLEKTLRETGATLVKCTSGNDALSATLEHDFALAILDVQMPGMDGYELAEVLRGDPKTQHLPIIFLTAERAEEAAIFKGYEAGAVDYIVKPYNQAVLRAKVNVFLQLDRQRQELQRHKVLLEASNRELEAFAYSVSHDLRAPLRAIEGFSHALMEDYPDKLNTTGKDYLQRVSSEAQRMAQLINDLLMLSRVVRAEMRSEEVDLAGLAHGTVDELRQGEPGRRVDVSIADDLVVTGDSRLLRQVLDNLIGNAWKFSAARRTARIEMGAFDQEGKRVFFVKDNGIGFDMQYADNLLAPFQRLHGMKEFSGTGIGLSTVHRIIQRHGGRVWFESELDQGATFFFTLHDKEDDNE